MGIVTNEMIAKVIRDHAAREHAEGVDALAVFERRMASARQGSRPLMDRTEPPDDAETGSEAPSSS